MTIEEMQRIKMEKGYSYAQIAEESGVPLGTVRKIFTGETAHPRYDTLLALEKFFCPDNLFSEAVALYHRSPTRKGIGPYTIHDYQGLPEEQRAELIDGYFHDMAAPTTTHQKIAGEIYRQIANFIYDQDGACTPLIAPVDVQLDCDEKTMMQPDVAIVCNREQDKKWGIYGAPDFVVEITSPNSRKRDYITKLNKYSNAGVREYWIIDPIKKNLLVYFFEQEDVPYIAGLEQEVPVNIYEGRLKIDFSRISKWIDEK